MRTRVSFSAYLLKKKNLNSSQFIVVFIGRGVLESLVNMKEDTNIDKAISQHIEMEHFFTGGFGAALISGFQYQ